MSADNYFLIRRHPKGGYAAVMGFASNHEDPDASETHRSYPTVEAALYAVRDDYTEYGISVHAECWAGEK